ncbi:MAG: alpha/beta fold hydrolase [Candidatus Omnitrophica bacterium]|nr:Monoacylglycerol lipase [bacterium]NUN96424.1 alpha/beta fold hydrolase [Candidatus Omnitrophota bacterium]
MLTTTESEFHLKTREGYDLFCKRWTPEGPAKGARILLTHGIESHTGWYEDTARALAERGFEVSSLDRRGFGRSGGPKGHVESAEDFFADLAVLTGFLHEEAEGRPVFAIGVSLGGLLVAAHAMRSPQDLAGVVSVVPAIAVRIKPKPLQILQASFDNLTRPERKYPLGIPIEMFSEREEVKTFIESDELRTRQVSVRFFFSISRIRWWVVRNAPLMRTPLQVLLGEKDEMIDNDRIRRWTEKVPGRPLEVRQYPGVKHSILLEPCRGQAVDDIQAFVDQVTRA